MESSELGNTGDAMVSKNRPPAETSSEKEQEHPTGRRQKRYEVDLQLTIDSLHNFFVCSARNLSASGIFVATQIVYPIGTLVDCTIHLGGRLVKVVGEVRWLRAEETSSIEPQGMGLTFVDLSREDDAAVRVFLEGRDPIVYEGGVDGDLDGEPRDARRSPSA